MERSLLIPIAPRHGTEHAEERRTLMRMEFATYCAAFIQMPCQLVRTGGRLILPAAVVEPVARRFLRLVERLNGGWQC